MAQVTSDVSSDNLDAKAKVANAVDDEDKPKASVYKVRLQSIGVCIVLFERGETSNYKMSSFSTISLAAAVFLLGVLVLVGLPRGR